MRYFTLFPHKSLRDTSPTKKETVGVGGPFWHCIGPRLLFHSCVSVVLGRAELIHGVSAFDATRSRPTRRALLLCLNEDETYCACRATSQFYCICSTATWDRNAR